MKKANLNECMGTLGFSELERKIYLTLLRGGTTSAYQIAKKIEISRPSIYNALEHMAEKGMVEIIPNDTALYAAQSPEILLGKMREEFTRSIDIAEELLKEYIPSDYGEQYANVKGFDAILLRAKQIMRNSRTEIYINTDMSVDCFAKEFKLLSDKGIRVVVYSFYDMGEVENCEIYSHGRSFDAEREPSRLMVVADNAMALTAGPDSEKIWQGTVTGNRLFVKIISEHIHNDIYLLKLRDKFGKDIYNDLHIFTDYEKRNRQ